MLSLNKIWKNSIWQDAQIGDLEEIKNRVWAKGNAIINTEKDSDNGWTALMWASFNGHLPVVQYLISNGANINDQDNDGRTALTCASSEGYTDGHSEDQTAIVQYLIKSGADLNHKTNTGSTALTFASESGHLSIIKDLIRHGANINDKTNYGETALHWAGKPKALVSDSCATEIIKTLLANGADETIKNTDNKTPAEFAHNICLYEAITQAAQDKQNGRLEVSILSDFVDSSFIFILSE